MRASWQCNSCLRITADAREVNIVTVGVSWWVVCNDCKKRVRSNATVESMVDYRDRIDAHD